MARLSYERWPSYQLYKFEKSKSCYGNGIVYFVLLSFAHEGKSWDHKMAIVYMKRLIKILCVIFVHNTKTWLNILTDNCHSFYIFLWIPTLAIKIHAWNGMMAIMWWVSFTWYNHNGMNNFIVFNGLLWKKYNCFNLNFHLLHHNSYPLIT